MKSEERLSMTESLVEVTPDHFLGFDINVDMEEWQATSQKVVIGTTGLGPCLGIGIYDKESRRAYVGHFVDFYTNHQNLRELLSDAKESATRLADLSIWITGGAIEPAEVQVREEAIDVIESTGLKNCIKQIRWIEPNEIANLAIDVATGHAYISVRNVEELREIINFEIDEPLT